MPSRAGHKNSRTMRYWFKDYQVEFVYLLNSSCHQNSNSLTPGSTSPFSRIPSSFGFGSCIATWKINTSSCFAFCAKLCRVICSPAVMTQLHFLVLFFPVGAGIISPIQTSLSPYHILHSGGLLELVFLPLNSVGLGTKRCFSSSSPP